MTEHSDYVLTMPSGYAICQKNTWVCADLAAEAIPAFTDAGEFGAGEFTPGKQAGKHQIKECRLVIQGTRGERRAPASLPGGKIARNTAHEASWSPAIRDSVQHVGQPGFEQGAAGHVIGIDRQAARGHEQIGPCSWISRTASAMRVTSSGAMTERTTSQWN